MEDNDLPSQVALTEQELQRVTMHLKAIEEESVQMSQLSQQIASSGNFSSKKIISQLGRGVFLPCIVEKNEFLVQVGAGIMVSRSVEDVRQLLEKNISQLNDASYRLLTEREFYEQQLQNLFSQIKNQ